MANTTTTVEAAQNVHTTLQHGLAQGEATGRDAAIKIEGLSVMYGKLRAVDNVTFDVQPGEIFGLLGPNGAGKTTILSTIEGLVKPNAGRVSVLGYDVTRHSAAVKRLLGISLQTTAFFDNLKVWELLRLYATMYEVFLSKAEVMEMLARFELADKAGAKAEELSGGQQQRLALALALANDPRIVILDEPTTGLDPQARRHVWDIVREIRAEGRTVLLTTHYMEEAQELCHRIGVIDRGELIALDTPGGLINKLQADTVVTATVRLPQEELVRLPGVKSARYEGGKLTVTTADTQETVFGMQKLAVEHRQLLTDLSVKQPDLEDVFIALTGRKMR
jgi:ABC-2 type transport system ATP-binding protein